MATLKKLVADFLARERSVGIVISVAQVEAQACAALRMYAGYGQIASLLKPVQLAVDAAGLCASAADWFNALGALYKEPCSLIGAEVSYSEWAVVRPLFILYVDREQALHLEATRFLGVDGFGRSSSEIQQDIMTHEQDLPRHAFGQPVLTI